VRAAIHLVSILLFASSASPSLGQVAIHPTADAHVVDGSSANTNFGASPKLQVQKSSTVGNNRIAYLTFDISILPATLQWVRVRVYVAPPGWIRCEEPTLSALQAASPLNTEIGARKTTAVDNPVA
jgi:hypothetical protein